MGAGVAVLVFGLMIPPDGAATLARAAARFETWFAADVADRLTIPEPVGRAAMRFRYVFVGGFRNERMPGYFVQNIAELKAQGIAPARIHVIQPSSSRALGANATVVRSRLLEVAALGTERLVVIGHSRGACDTLLFALENGPFVEERVEALFLIQGPFGGSGLADSIVGRGVAMDRRMPWAHRVLNHWFGRLARFELGPAGMEALEGLTRAASRAFWNKTLADHAGSVAVVGPKTFYVRTRTEPAQLHFVRRALAWYLSLYHGPSDGMVEVADQMLPGLGTVVATLEAGHTDLTHRFPATRAPRRMRRALVRAILMTVGRPDAEVAVERPPGD